MTHEIVSEIRRMVLDGKDDLAIALKVYADHNIEMPLLQVSLIRRNRTWKDVPWPLNPGEEMPRRQLDDLDFDDKADIRRRLASGEAGETVAAEYGVTKDTIGRLMHKQMVQWTWMTAESVAKANA